MKIPLQEGSQERGPQRASRLAIFGNTYCLMAIPSTVRTLTRSIGYIEYHPGIQWWRHQEVPMNLPIWNGRHLLPSRLWAVEMFLFAYWSVFPVAFVPSIVKPIPKELVCSSCPLSHFLLYRFSSLSPSPGSFLLSPSSPFFAVFFTTYPPSLFPRGQLWAARGMDR